MTRKTYRDLNHFLFENRRVTKTSLAKLLQIWPSKLTTLLNPDSYRVSIDDLLTDRIAAVLNQPPDYVRRLYERAA